jgi:hypothetical protein
MIKFITTELGIRAVAVRERGREVGVGEGVRKEGPEGETDERIRKCVTGRQKEIYI